MSMPHLDTRYVDGEKQLMFGPFAGFSPKFLKQGSNLDLVKSVNFKNIPSMLGAFWHNLDLTKYLISQVTMTFDGGDVVSDAGLLPVRQLDQELGILAEAARRLPDPRSELFVVHSAERILTQQVYQILAGYPDGNDAQLLRDDPLFKTIVADVPHVRR